MLAGLYVLKYLKGSPGNGLVFSLSSSLTLKGFSVSDWGECPDTISSKTSLSFFLGISLVTWKRKRLNVVSKSSFEAKYRALAQTTCEEQ